MNGRRRRSSLPDVYYEGYLERRSFRDKAALKQWTTLSGNTLFFFDSNKDAKYVDQLELADLQSVSYGPTQDSNLNKAHFNIRLKDKNVKFTAPSLETRELWMGYIHAVVKLSLPSDLTLLPGQTQDLLGAVEQERERRRRPPPLPPPALPDGGVGPQSQAGYKGPLPACYMQVTRVEAELLLEREAGRGNLLLRPGGHGNTFTMTTREVHMSSIFKHYRVTQTPAEGFIIDLKEPIACATLDDVISVMLEQTGGALIPFIAEENYEDNISFFKSNEESGEMSVFFPKSKTLPTPPHKPAFFKSNEESGETPRSKPLPTPPHKPADKKQEYQTVTEEPHSRIPSWSPKQSENAEKTLTKPSYAPPPLPNGAPKLASTPVTPKAPPRVALKPSTPTERGSREPEQGDRVSTWKPVPARRGPPLHYCNPGRSNSDMSRISAELREALKKRYTE